MSFWNWALELGHSKILYHKSTSLINLESRNSHSMMKILGKCMKELFPPPVKERRKKSYLKCLLCVIREGQQCTIPACIFT